MTRFGKILVCLNLVLSIAMAALALGLYTQRINWTTDPSVAQAQSAPDKAAGELALRRDRIDKVWPAMLAAEARQQTAASELRRLEQQRPADRSWYAAQLLHMEKNATEQNPAKMLVLGADGKLVPDDRNFGRPSLQNATDRSKLPLRSLEAYNTEKKQTTQLAAEERSKLTKLVEEDSALTQKATGIKGLRQLIEDEEEKRQRVEQEIKDIVRPNLVNVQVASELLIKRRNALRDRIQELEKAPVVSGQ